MDKDDKFTYTYSAPTEEERKEIDGIRRAYRETQKSGDDKMSRLRKLDARVKNTAACVALAMGILGCLIFGLGMSMVLVWEQTVFGIVVSLLGVAAMGLAAPVHRRVFRRQKRKYGEEILRLSEELLNEK